jgi:GT2 family glycosyltransferase
MGKNLIRGERVPGLVSIVTINFNQAKVTGEFLKSLYQSEYGKLEVIVVDNNSDEDPEEYLKDIYKKVNVVKAPSNLGFTGGNNLGILNSHGEFIFVVNNDTEITPTLIGDLLLPFKDPKYKIDQTKKGVGMTSPKIKYFDNPKMIQYAGYSKINPWHGRNSSPGKGVIDSGQKEFQGQYETAYAHGAAIMLSAEVIMEVGGFDNEFFIYYEELDWSQRVKNAGYRIIYCGDSVIYHKESITTGKNSPFKEKFHTKNRIYFMRKHSNSLQFFVYCLYFIGLVIPKKLVQYLPTMKKDHLKAFWLGVKWNFNKKTKLI